MKKICFIIANISNSGGSEKMCCLLTNYLANNNFKVTVLSILGNDTSFFKLDKKVKVERIYPNNNDNYISMFAKNKLKKYFSENNFDYVIDVDSIHSPITSYALSNTDTKHIVWDHFNFNHNMKNAKRKTAVENAIKNSWKFVVLSKDDLASYKLKYDNYKDKIVQIYDGVPAPSKTKDAKDKNKTVVTLGRNCEQKGYVYLLNAWKLIEKDAPDWKLKIYGSDCTNKKLTDLSNKLHLNNVEFFKATNDVDSVLLDSQIYISSAIYEGLGLSIIEAMQRKVPVVAFDCSPCISELIKNNNEGLLVAPKDYKSLAKSAIKLIENENLQKTLANNAYKKSKQFCDNNFYKEWLKIIK